MSWKTNVWAEASAGGGSEESNTFNLGIKSRLWGRTLDEDGSWEALALNAVHVPADFQDGTNIWLLSSLENWIWKSASARLAVIVGYTAKLTHTCMHTHTHTAVNNEAASAGFKEPGLLASVFMGQNSMSGWAGLNCEGIFNVNTEQATQI